MKFRDFIDVRDGTHDSPKSVSGIGYPLVTTKHLGNGFIDLSNTNNISEEDYIAINKRSKVDQFDILISMIGTVGSVYQERQSQPGYAIKNVGLLKFNGDETLSNYVYYWLKSSNGQNEIKVRLKGTTQQFLSLTELRNLTLELPSREEMNLAVKPLMILDQKMYSLGSINDNLLELAQQIFVGKYLSKQDSFPMTTLSEIVGVKTDTFNPKKSNDNEVAHFSLPAFDSGSVPTVDLVDSIKSNKNIITQYTVLASKMNPTTKRVWIPNYVQGMTNVASTEFLTFNASDEYQQAFIWAVVDSEGYQNHLISGATGSTGSRQRIKPGDAYSFEVGYNPDEAHRIGMILNPLLQQVKNNRDEIVTLVQLRNNLLTNLLN